MSLREISRQTGIPKTTVKTTLNALGLALRNYASGQRTSLKRDSAQKPGRPPYGYGYVDGQLAIDPREYSVVKQILNLWQSGKNIPTITAHLNDKKISSRNQTQWTRCVVRSILRRHESKTNKPEGK